MRKAVNHFQSNGLETKEAPIDSFQILTECGIAQFFTMEDVPSILKDGAHPKKMDNVYAELFKSAIGKSKYSFAGLFFCFLYETNGLIPKRRIPKYVRTGEKIRQKLLVICL